MEGKVGQSRWFGLIIGAVLFAGCQSTPVVEPEESPEITTEAVEEVPMPVPTPDLTAKERLALAISLLQSGDAEQARVELQAYRAELPNSRIAQRLLDQIELPIAKIFPSEAFEVVLEPGQSLSSLAGTYLGDSLMFYALARYNGIDKPSQVRAGQALQVPLTEKAIAARAAPKEVPPLKEVPPVEEVVEEVVEEAAEEVVEVVHEVPEESLAEVKLRNGRAAAAGGDAIGAHALLSEALELDAGNAEIEAELTALEPALVDAHYRAAVSAFSQQDLQATIEHCDAVLAIDPTHSNAELYRVQALELQERLQKLNAN